MVKYNKIVRDKIPDIIVSTKKTCDVSYVSDKDAIEFLARKILEEGKEFCDNPSKEELADLYEVLDAIAEKKKWKKSDIDKVRADKAKKNGLFKNNIILKIIHDDLTE